MSPRHFPVVAMFSISPHFRPWRVWYATGKWGSSADFRIYGRGIEIGAADEFWYNSEWSPSRLVQERHSHGDDGDRLTHHRRSPWKNTRPALERRPGPPRNRPGFMEAAMNGCPPASKVFCVFRVPATDDAASLLSLATFQLCGTIAGVCPDRKNIDRFYLHGIIRRDCDHRHLDRALAAGGAVGAGGGQNSRMRGQPESDCPSWAGGPMQNARVV